jgi:hypothetical protein
MDKFKGHGFMLEHGYGYWLVAMLNVEPNNTIMILEPFMNGIDAHKIMSGQSIKLTDDEQDMIFNENISPGYKSFSYWEFLNRINITITLRTHFDNPSILMQLINRPPLIWKCHDKDDEFDPYEYKQIGQYFCRMPKTNKIYLDMIKDDDKYVKIWLLMMELHDIRAQIVWNMITLNRLDVDNYVDIY